MECKLRHYLFLAALVAAAFYPVFSADFLNFDDPSYLTQNAAVLSFDLKAMFSETVLDTYIPLTSLSFAVEKALFGLNPFIFHLDNALLHFGVAALLMGFFVRLGARPLAAFLGAALFAVHPMRVESVAWVTERKDMLYALFYVLALRQWWAYLEKRKYADMALTLLWACLSLLAKPMAVSLPLAMAFLEWFSCGDIRKVRWAFYAPFVTASVLIGMTTATRLVHMPVADPGVGILIWIWTLAFYIWKFFLPFVFHPVYALPTPIGFLEPAYLGSIVLLVLIGWHLWKTARLHLDRWLLFAAGMFFLSIFFMLRFDALGIHIVADRFMYLASAGICLWLGVKGEQALERYGWPAQAVIIGLFCLLIVRTFTYAQVWKDSVSLWSYVIAQYPQKEIAYNNRAIAYGDSGRFDLAVKDLSQAMPFALNKALAFYNRGLSFRDWAKAELKGGRSDTADKLYRLALADLDEALRLDPRFPRTYNHRALIRHYLHDDAGALEDLANAIRIDPQYGEALNSRGNIRAQRGELDLALQDYQGAIRSGSGGAQAYSNMGIIYARKGLGDLALQSLNKALQIDPRHAESYFNRSVIRRSEGKLKAALADAWQARALGLAVDEKYLLSLQEQNGDGAL